VSIDNKLSEDELANLPRRVMDCMDCHNRPTHIYPPPEGAVDIALSSGLISPKLPWIKRVAVDALVREYPDRDAAVKGITDEITAFYAAKYPDVSTSSAPEVAQACATASEIYSRSVFPKMRVNWQSYASNIGHRNWPGCFRCHDGKHANNAGKTLTIECTVCHTMPQRGPLAPIGAEVPASSQGWHPWELKGKHETMLCNRCHAAGYRPPTECAECHKLDSAAPMMTSGCDTCHAAEQEVQPINGCASCHDSLGELHKAGGHPDAACVDCHKPHGWKVTARADCLTCHDDKAEHYAEEKAACVTCHEFAAAS
jgi:hypothetical protein